MIRDVAKHDPGLPAIEVREHDVHCLFVLFSNQVDFQGNGDRGGPPKALRLKDILEGA